MNEAIVTLGVLAALIWFTLWLVQGPFERMVESRRRQRAYRRQREQMTRAWLIKHWESERIAQTYADDFVEWEREWSEHHGRSER